MIKPLIKICCMYKLVNVLFFCCLLLTTLAISSCDQDDPIKPSFNDVTFDLQLLDTNGSEAILFSTGSDVVFQITMSNNSHDTLLYYEGLKCATMKFEIYKDNVLVGHPHPNNWGCTEELEQMTLEPNGIINTQISWLENPLNKPFQSGNYSVLFKTRLALGKPIKWRDIEQKASFEVK